MQSISGQGQVTIFQLSHADKIVYIIQIRPWMVLSCFSLQQTSREEENKKKRGTVNHKVPFPLFFLR